MISHHWRAGFGDWWRGLPRPASREGAKGWDQAEREGQEGPLGVFNVWRRTYPPGCAMTPEWVGQVVANNARDAVRFARLAYQGAATMLLDAYRQDRDPNNAP